MSYIIEEQPLSYWWKLHSRVNFSHELYYTVKFWKWAPENMPPPILKQKKASLSPWYSFFIYIKFLVVFLRRGRLVDEIFPILSSAGMLKQICHFGGKMW